MASVEAAEEELREAVAHALRSGGSVRQVHELTGFSTRTIQDWGHERGWPTKEQRDAKARVRARTDEFQAQLDAAERLLKHVDE